MEKVKKMVGGFAGINEGKISNSYSKITINTKASIGEFCYRNEGAIIQSFSTNSRKDNNEKKVFCVKNRGNVDEYFYADNENIKSSIKEKLNIEKLRNELHWDFNNIWRGNKLSNLKFNEETYLQEFPVNGNIIEIHNAKDLLQFAKKVNKGFEKYRNANVILKRNINLKGKKWIPIGLDKYNSFCGTFNGNGHTIENFKIYQDKLNYVGFFGYIQGATICNLKIDCTCKGKRCIGAFAGINDKGRILSCRAITNIHIGETTGGFVGKNTGEISKCCVIGKMISPIIWLPLIRNIIIGILVIMAIVLLVNKYYKEKVFVPVAIDPNVIMDEEQDEEFTGSATDNKASFDFSQTVTVNAKNMIGTLDFRNPKRGNHNIVIKLLISDKELKETMGTTGRSKEKQDEIEKQEGYSEENNMTLLYQSGLIERGYKLPKIQISNLEDGSKLQAGTYEAIVSLEFYKIETNEKAIVKTNLPVTIVVK